VILYSSKELNVPTPTNVSRWNITNDSSPPREQTPGGLHLLLHLIFMEKVHNYLQPPKALDHRISLFNHQ